MTWIFSTIDRSTGQSPRVANRIAISRSFRMPAARISIHRPKKMATPQNGAWTPQLNHRSPPTRRAIAFREKSGSASTSKISRTSRSGWNDGVLESWSDAKNSGPQHSITPSLQYSGHLDLRIGHAPELRLRDGSQRAPFLRQNRADLRQR